MHTSAEVATSSEYITQYVTYRTGILDGLRKKWNNEETFLACCQHSSRVGDVSLLGHKLFSSYWTFFCNTFTNIRAHRSDSGHLVAPQGYSSVQF